MDQLETVIAGVRIKQMPNVAFLFLDTFIFSTHGCNQCIYVQHTHMDTRLIFAYRREQRQQLTESEMHLPLSVHHHNAIYEGTKPK